MDSRLDLTSLLLGHEVVACCWIVYYNGFYPHVKKTIFELLTSTHSSTTNKQTSESN